MKQSDRQLGMHRDISRRDFIQGVGLASVGLGLPAASLAEAVTGNPESSGKIYPPTRTGLRGSHPGSFEVGHTLARNGNAFATPRDLGEVYDLIVVGGGISGLAAAQFYQERYGQDARILILENHDDFGGHARRNEFHQGGQMRLSLGGTHNLEYWSFSKTVKRYLATLGIDPEKLVAHKEFAYGSNSRHGRSTWFDADTYGEDKLVAGFSVVRGREGQSLDRIDEIPISEAAKAQLKNLYSSNTNVLEGLDEEAVWDYLATVSYPDFLRQHAGLGDEALQLFDNTMHGFWGTDIRVLSASEALDSGFPGLNLLDMGPYESQWDYTPAMFPDGNASVARLQVQQLIPKVSPGANADNIALASFDYSELDRPGSPVRMRLNSTVIRARNTEDGVEVTYVNGGQPSSVKSRHCVLACWHEIVPHLCPDMPTAQKQAQKHQVKMPLLLTNVLVRSSKALDELGIDGIHCPGRMHANLFMFKGINTGGYEHRMEDDGPVPLVFWGSISPPRSAVTAHDQFRASRARMLALTFEDYEREVRTVLDGLLGPAGFDVQEDILAITVNRWPHGYAYNYFDLWDEDYAEGEAPHEIARQPFGNITLANADAGADAYTHVAIDEAWRAVNELPT